MSIEIYDLMGEKILLQKSNVGIDISNIPKGIYFIKISDGTKIYNQKIVVQQYTLIGCQER
ncbi:MAG: hypothetical protein A3H98_12370 [Bacteroidetes bacterium RIFCSPLOWO2_02_FULL_36_8]|nr:MAG: hypothetical protein A3H98_12370 [Bacteroidetes bacterium RIFCSPLOWO2_02_FULL_36_8]OFY71089.1 MAG: hypothetical protein A3G23_14865 [Bacteroidetes bacterium RIFCSPLOWO2_12_FULL_37_12]